MRKRPSILFCLLMDTLGSISMFFPVFGEWFDILWAPLSAYIFYRTFGGKTGKIGAFVNLLEESLPYFDFIPTFTLGYAYDWVRSRKKVNVSKVLEEI